MPSYLGVATDDPDLRAFKLSGSGSTRTFALGRISQALTPVSVAAASAVEQNFTVPGILVGDFVDVSPPSIVAGVAPICARVSAANTLTVTFINPTIAAITPAAGVYQIQVMR